MQKNKILKRIDRIIFQAIVMGDNLTADEDVYKRQANFLSSKRLNILSRSLIVAPWISIELGVEINCSITVRFWLRSKVCLRFIAEDILTIS